MHGHCYSCLFASENWVGWLLVPRFHHALHYSDATERFFYLRYNCSDGLDLFCGDKLFSPFPLELNWHGRTFPTTAPNTLKHMFALDLYCFTFSKIGNNWVVWMNGRTWRCSVKSIVYLKLTEIYTWSQAC